MTGKQSSITADVGVLNWVWRQSRAGLQRAEIVELSRTSEDFPLQGEKLSDGNVTALRTAIFFLEEQGVRFPLTPGGVPRKRKSQTSGRLAEIKKLRAQARKAGDPVLFWDVCYEVTRAASYLESIEVEHVDLTQENLTLLDDLHTDLLRLQVFQDRVTGAVQARLSEERLVAKIKAMRAKTVAAGATAEEAKTAYEMAERLERKLANVLTA